MLKKSNTPKRKSKTYWITKLDKLVAQLVKEKNRCDMCGKGGGRCQLQAAHIITRSNKRLRWDLQNLLCLCAGCHWRWHKEPLQSINWFNAVYPERAEYLLKAKNEIMANIDYAKEYDDLKNHETST